LLGNGNIVAGTESGYIYIYNMNTLVRQLMSVFVTTLQVIPNNQIVSGHQDSFVRIWDLETGSLLQNFTESYLVDSAIVIRSIGVQSLHNYNIIVGTEAPCSFIWESV
jgi:WD40 repeat protein